MRHILFIIALLPYVVFSQGGTKPAPAKKPAATTATKKPAAAATKKPATTAVKKTAPAKPAGTVPKKANPQVVKLTEKAYAFYRDSKDAECEKTIKQILALDPRNKDAFLLRANIAMFNGKYDEMWANLDKIYKFNPGEPEIYSNFAVTHLNYMFLSDSMKRVLCRKTIKLAGGRSDGYVNLGMVAMAGGYYQDAISCFDISFGKKWKDTMNKVILNLYYARCMYGVGDTAGAISVLDGIIPRLSGNDRYTSIFLRSKYKLDMKDTAVRGDLDTLNSYASDQPDVWILNAKYFSLTGRRDSACMLAKKVRGTEGGEAFDLSEYCDDLTRKLDMLRFRKLTYSLGDIDFVISLSQFNYPGGIQFSWERGNSIKERGTVYMAQKALDSAYHQSNVFNKDADISLDRNITFWLSRAQYRELNADKSTRISIDGINLFPYRVVGHEQIEVFNEMNKEVLLDCIVISDGVNKICYLDDPENPLIVKIESERYAVALMKFE